MRILLLEGSTALGDALATVLERAGHSVVSALEPKPPVDVVLLGLPAPAVVVPEKLPDAPLVLLVRTAPHGELERWIAGRRRWSLLPKPVPEAALFGTLARLEAPLAAAALR